MVKDNILTTEQEFRLPFTDQEENFLVTEHEYDLLNDEENAKTIPAAKAVRALPVVPFVRILNSGDPSDCPFDRYMMNKKMAMLEYSKDKEGGSVIPLQVLLRSCPQCGRLYIDIAQLNGLQKAGLDIGCFDIIGSSVFPRTKGYERWHPEAVKKAASTAAVAASAATVKKPKAPRKASVKKTVHEE